jgi:hypothetical protein
MILRTSVLTTGLLLAATSSAFAADHLMKVSEVLISQGGSTSSQFVELQDPTVESFPGNPYTIEVFNAAGASVGSQPLTIAPSTSRFLIATAQAQIDFGVTAQAILTVALPADGQVCFTKTAGRIHCFGWGTITSSVIGMNGTDTGPAPTDSHSVQRTASGYFVGVPTPGAANIMPPPFDMPPDAGTSVPDASAPDASGPMPDAGNGNPNNPSDGGGCNIGGGASWLLLVGLAALVLIRRSSTRR